MPKNACHVHTACIKTMYIVFLFVFLRTRIQMHEHWLEENQFILVSLAAIFTFNVGAVCILAVKIGRGISHIMSYLVGR